MAALTQSSSVFETPYLLDWLQGLQATVRDNAAYLAGVAGDVHANARLGEILAALRTCETGW